MKEVVIIGGGIAGCSSAYFLKKAGFKVTLFEKNTICSGASLAAGAFLSPKLSKPSPYKDYLNSALKFSLDFYKNFPNSFKKTILKKIPKDKDDWQKLQSYEKYIDFKYKKRDNYYELNFAGMVEPKEICYELTKGIEIYEHTPINSLENFSNKIVIIAHPNQNYLDIPYLRTKDIGGYRYDVVFKDCDKKDFNSHKDISISCYFKNKIVIGATYQRGEKELEKSAQNDSQNLIKKAKDFFDMQELKILKYYTGYRNMTFDYFPIVGKLINSDETLKKYPYIKKGTKVPPSLYIYYKDIYIHTALGSRGFVYAPYNAKLLTDQILQKKDILEKLSPVRLFKKIK